MDMPTTMSKFLAMGEPLVEVIRESTINPATEIQHPELGHMSAGAPADVAVWELRTGDFGFADASGGKLSGKQRLLCQLTVRDGKIVWDRNSRAADDYRKLGPTYGVRDVDKIVPPRH
jgi:dihydroorotase